MKIFFSENAYFIKYGAYWEVIVFSFAENTEEVSGDTFTQTLLKQIVSLTGTQQLDLVADLAESYTKCLGGNSYKC